MKVLTYLFYNSHEAFNRSKYCRDFNEAPSTIRSAMVRLMGKGLLSKSNLGVYEVTENGKKLISVTRQGQKRGVETSRQGVSTGANLSMHQVKFKMPIICRKNFDKSRLKSYNYKSVENGNLKTHYVYLEHLTISITSNYVFFHIREVMATNLDDGLVDCMDILIKHLSILDEFKIKAEKIILEDAHFARVQSLFSEYISKVDDNYYLDLGDGKKFWVDRSTGELEDETNKVEVRERLDNFMKDMLNSDSVISDVDKMKEASSNMLKILSMLIQKQLKEDDERTKSVNLGRMIN